MSNFFFFLPYPVGPVDMHVKKAASCTCPPSLFAPRTPGQLMAPLAVARERHPRGAARFSFPRRGDLNHRMSCPSRRDGRSPSTSGAQTVTGRFHFPELVIPAESMDHDFSPPFLWGEGSFSQRGPQSRDVFLPFFF